MLKHTKFILTDESKDFNESHIKKLQNHILAHKSMKYALSQLEQTPPTNFIN